MNQSLANEPESLAGKDFRVRQINIELIVDLYDDTGRLLDRPTTNKIVILEAHFPPALVALLKQGTNLGRGFAEPLAPPIPIPPLAPPAE